MEKTNWKQWVRELIAQKGEDATPQIVGVIEALERGFETAQKNHRDAIEVGRQAIALYEKIK